MKKSITFIYGILAYLVFLVAFLYAIGFIGNFIVPKSIDSGLETSFWEALLINILLMAVFAMQHSVMARPAFKKWMAPVIDAAMERSTYVLMSSLALILLYWKWQPMKSIVWEVENNTLIVALKGIYFLGWLIVFLSSFMISHFELFGLKQIFDNLKERQAQDPKFQTNYLYKIVRHPIMLGFLIAFWATPVMSIGHLVFAIATTVYVFVAVKYLEEKDLRKSLGKEYEEYQKKVPMILPFTKRGK